MNKKLMDLVLEVFEAEAEKRPPKINVPKLVKEIAKYNELSKHIYSEDALHEMGKKFHELCNVASRHIEESAADWFDSISLKKDTKFLRSVAEDFQKAATDSHILNQRLTVLFENAGHILGRYYDITDSKVKEIKESKLPKRIEEYRVDPSVLDSNWFRSQSGKIKKFIQQMVELPKIYLFSKDKHSAFVAPDHKTANKKGSFAMPWEFVKEIKNAAEGREIE